MKEEEERLKAEEEAKEKAALLAEEKRLEKLKLEKEKKDREKQKKKVGYSGGSRLAKLRHIRAKFHKACFLTENSA